MKHLTLLTLLVFAAPFGWGNSSGTGFLVSPKGHLVTNQHVVSDCSAITFKVAGVVYSAVVVATDNVNDLALLKGDMKNSSFLRVGETRPALMETIYAAGFPFGEDVSSTIKVTKGIVSSLSGIGSNYSQLQIDAALQPGNSGGPVVNTHGNVIGVAVSKLSAKYSSAKYGALPENVNFAVKGTVVGGLLRANGLEVYEPNAIVMDTATMARTLTEATVPLICEKATKAAKPSQRTTSDEPTAPAQPAPESAAQTVKKKFGKNEQGIVTREQWATISIGMTANDLFKKLGLAYKFLLRDGLQARIYCSKGKLGKNIERYLPIYQHVAFVGANQYVVAVSTTQHYVDANGFYNTGTPSVCTGGETTDSVKWELVR